MFGNFRKFSENFGNGSKVIFRCFYDFLKFSENLRKSLEVFGNLRKRFSDVIGNVCNGLQELKGFGARLDPSKLLRARNDGKVEWNITCCILPVAYRRICNGNPGLWLVVFFKAWDKS